MTDDHLRVLVSAKAVICQDGKVILAKNGRGEWDLPGGKLKDGESIEAALRRELPADTIPAPYLEPIRSWCKRAET